MWSAWRSARCSSISSFFSWCEIDGRYYIEEARARYWWSRGFTFPVKWLILPSLTLFVENSKMGTPLVVDRNRFDSAINVARVSIENNFCSLKTIVKFSDHSLLCWTRPNQGRITQLLSVADYARTRWGVGESKYAQILGYEHPMIMMQLGLLGSVLEIQYLLHG